MVGAAHDAERNAADDCPRDQRQRRHDNHRHDGFALGARERRRGASKLVYDWSITSAPAGGKVTFSPSGTNAAQNTSLIFNKAGTYGVSVKIVDSSGLSVSTSQTLTVTPTLTGIKVSTPSGAVVSSTTSLQVSAVSQSLLAQGLDQFGNVLATQPAFKWSTSTVPSGAPTPTSAPAGAPKTSHSARSGLTASPSRLLPRAARRSRAKATLLVVAKPSYITVTQVGGASTVTGTTAQFSVSQFQDQFHNFDSRNDQRHLGGHDATKRSGSADISSVSGTTAR